MKADSFSFDTTGRSFTFTAAKNGSASFTVFEVKAPILGCPFGNTLMTLPDSRCTSSDLATC
jgi:hypothetical protein